LVENRFDCALTEARLVTTENEAMVVILRDA
jgi:hypothetical protein